MSWLWLAIISVRTLLLNAFNMVQSLLEEQGVLGHTQLLTAGCLSTSQEVVRLSNPRDRNHWRHRQVAQLCDTQDEA